MSSEQVVKEGWVLKQSRHLKQWRQRWLVLTAKSLCAYTAKPEIGSKPTEVLVIKECGTVKSADEEAMRENAFRVDSGGRMFLIVTDSPTTKEEWIGCIGQKIVLARPSVLKEQCDDDFEDPQSD